jgi:hypothetical protein
VLERGSGRQGVVSAQLRAVNTRGMTSPVVGADVAVDDLPPSLTGQWTFCFVTDIKKNKRGANGDCLTVKRMCDSIQYCFWRIYYIIFF